MSPTPRSVTGWWRDAVVYQLYIRSFADADGDGTGDIGGVRSRLDHLVELGVDALWVNPWYPSPQADAGYDVADFRDIDPLYGTLDDADALVRDAHAAGLKVLLDIVPNHTSSEHEWFRAALAGDAGARDRYHFRPGRGEDGEQPPNDWTQQLRRPGLDPDHGRRRHARVTGTSTSSPPSSPTSTGTTPRCAASSRTSCGSGSTAVSTASASTSPTGWPRRPGSRTSVPAGPAAPTTCTPPSTRTASTTSTAAWRKVADSYDPPRIFVAESWPPSSERLSLYLRPDELHQAFQFDLLRAPFDARMMKAVITTSLHDTEGVGATCTWTLSNHDVARQVTRYARSQPPALVDGHWDRRRWHEEPADLELGLRRARAAALLMLALPGSVYLYQGEELGLPEVEDLDDDRREDPIFARSGSLDVGRDGCRVPLPWDTSAPTYAFGPEGGARAVAPATVRLGGPVGGRPGGGPRLHARALPERAAAAPGAPPRRRPAGLARHPTGDPGLPPGCPHMLAQHERPAGRAARRSSAARVRPGHGRPIVAGRRRCLGGHPVTPGSTHCRRPARVRGALLNNRRNAMRFKHSASVMALALLITPLAACGGDDSSSSSGGDNPAFEENLDSKGPITYVQGKDNTGVVAVLIDKWNKEHPDEKVTVKEQTDEANQQHDDLVRNLDAQNADYDVMSVDLVWTAEFAAKGYLQPLEGRPRHQDRRRPAAGHRLRQLQRHPVRRAADQRRRHALLPHRSREDPAEVVGRDDGDV